MTWVRIEETAPWHPKHQRAGLAAFGFWVASLCYANRHLTDGQLMPNEVSMIWPGLHYKTRNAAVKALLANGQWSLEADGCYRIHDFLDYQPSREHVLNNRARIHEIRQQAGRMGGLRSAEVRRAHTSPDPKQIASEEGSKPEANASEANEAKLKPRPDPLTTKAFVVSAELKPPALNPPPENPDADFIAAEAKRLKERFAPAAARFSP